MKRLLAARAVCRYRERRSDVKEDGDLPVLMICTLALLEAPGGCGQGVTSRCHLLSVSCWRVRAEEDREVRFDGVSA